MPAVSTLRRGYSILESSLTLLDARARGSPNCGIHAISAPPAGCARTRRADAGRDRAASGQGPGLCLEVGGRRATRGRDRVERVREGIRSPNHLLLRVTAASQPLTFGRFAPPAASSTASTRPADAATADLTSHSQKRSTRQPDCSSRRVARRSRARFRRIFARQRSRFGPLNSVRPCTGQPCQKQPSTRTATRALAKTMSPR